MKRTTALLLALLTAASLTGCWPGGSEAAKPVIYLYPEAAANVSVELDYDGRLTCTYPVYEDGWSVAAAPDGTLTELPQQMYCDARGTTPVNILDIQNGLVFLQYAYDTVPVSSYDYEGNPYTYDTYLPVYGIIPLQELLAGSQNYRELTFD